MVAAAAMSEFKFACPVCGQHITADSSTSGHHIVCPTCFQKIIVPQAPSSQDTKLIVTAAQVAKPRPAATDPGLQISPVKPPSQIVSIMATVALLALLGVAGGAVWIYRDKFFKPAPQQQQPTNAEPTSVASEPPIKQYPVPTNFFWMQQVTNAVFPEGRASGSIHGSGFFCERAVLQGGDLILRQGRGGPPELGISVVFHTREGQELSGFSSQIAPDRAPPLPLVVLHWRDDAHKAAIERIARGYALKVAFGEAANGWIRGKIYICLPDDARSFVAGTFEAEIKKAPPPKRPSKTPKADG